MTTLLDDEQLTELKNIIIDRGLTGSRHLLFAGIDDRFVQALREEETGIGQMRSDLTRLSELPYLALDRAKPINPPLRQYLKNIVERLGGRQEADAVNALLSIVETRSQAVADIVGRLLDALALAHPSTATITAVTNANGTAMAQLGPDTGAWRTWAVALHDAALRDAHARLVELARDAADGEARAELDRCLERRTDWLAAVRDAADVHLFIEVPTTTRQLSWADVVESARATTAAVIADLAAVAGTQGAVGHDEVRVQRPRLDGVLADFAAGDCPALVLAGDSGVGKTSLVIGWASALADDGHAVVLLTGARLRPEDVWEQVRNDLDVPDAPDWLHAVGRSATHAGKRLYVIVDAANEYLDDRVAPADLFAAVNRRLDDLPDGVRIVVTFNQSSWSRVRPKVEPAIRWQRFFRSGADLAVTVPGFDDDELERAWARCQEVFGVMTPLLELPGLLRAQIHNPALMMLTATTFRASKVPQREIAAAIDLFRRYLELRTRSSPDPDREFLSDLSLGMYTEQRSPIPTRLLTQLERLKQHVSDQPDSVYARLLDNGVLRRVDLPREVPPDSVEYAVAQFGAYVLAGALRLEHHTSAGALEAARAHMDEFPLIVETIRILVSDVDDPGELIALADDARPLMRDVLVDALAELSHADPDTVSRVVHTLVSGAEMTKEQRRTGLLAAFAVSIATSGLDLRKVFVDIARGNDDALRQEARDVLYLIWRTHPRFTYQLLDAMADEVPSINLAATRRVVGFMGDLSITLYTNHPGWAVGKPTSDLWHKVAVERLHADRLDVVGIRNLVRWVADRVFSRKIFDGFLLNDPSAVRQIFSLGDAEKRPLREGVQLLEPDADISSAASHDLLATLLDAPWEMFRLLGAQAVAVHAVSHFEVAEPVVRELHERLSRDGKLWLLTAFDVLLDETPSAWVPMLEDLAAATLRDHPELRTDVQLGFLGQPLALDQLLFAPALAYAKQGRGMPLIEELVASGLADRSVAIVGRCIDAVGRVGFHHPAAALDVLARVWDRVGDPARQAKAVSASVTDATMGALGSIRMLHRDLVDDFHHNMDASADWRRGVVVAEQSEANRERLRAQVLLLGLYNNGVHQAVCFPKMRRGLLQPIYLMLGEHTSLERATKQLTATAWTMFSEADFRVENWAEPPCADGPCQ